MRCMWYVRCGVRAVPVFVRCSVCAVWGVVRCMGRGTAADDLVSMSIVAVECVLVAGQLQWQWRVCLLGSGAGQWQ